MTTLRVARPVTDLQRSERMYCDGLGLQKLGSFAQHGGFSGVMLGRRGLAWHLEFTVCHTHPVMPAPTEDDLLVLYVSDHEGWQTSCDRMVQAGFSVVASFNPYWERQGKTFRDPDGYRVVLQQGRWPNADL
ncbi:MULTISPECIES: VOC family protein [Dickeya]|uniref:VOC family protein n=1 Tax=Dickeya fangzhongdai TaxID=1778540 RepID=A0A2K8QIB6_9GAMM|nr:MULTISPECIES: VOC family protein [Dickeya]ATZ93243.1 VOC family protein [Dickeya fangzhongdai]MBO8135324.1 VOC family protein [Dickeya fangzhongdai]QOH46672.1 VOC family protein [Dickeya fangzhongdai]QOH50979.1 VOC family protein [Dickeya fangzhongdai]UGA51752.1 VOC family protein [Dickeya fangzhongdai]